MRVVQVCPNAAAICSEALARIPLRSPHILSTELRITLCLHFPWEGLLKTLGLGRPQSLSLLS